MGGRRSIREAEQVTLKNGKVWGNSGKGVLLAPPDGEPRDNWFYASVCLSQAPTQHLTPRRHAREV